MNVAPRLQPLTPDRLDDDQRRLYDAILASRRAPTAARRSGLLAEDGSLVGPFDAYLRQPAIGVKLAEMGEALRFDTTLPKPLQELAIIVVARAWTAQFEWYAHSRMALEAGVPADVVRAVAERREPYFDDDDLALVYRFAHQLATTHQVDDVTYAAAIERLGEAHVFELTATIAHYHAVSVLLNTFRVPLPAGVEPLAD